MKKKIFIQIPAYRDKELLPTIIDLNEKAADPGCLRIVIAWQYGADEEHLEEKLGQIANVELIKIEASLSRGCNWARSLIQQRWNGEKYTLFLDSHHRFVEGWDTTTIRMYEDLKERKVEKPVITNYFQAYDPDNDPQNRVDGLLNIVFKERDNGMLFKLMGENVTDWKQIDEPFKAKFTSLHFLFTDGKFNSEIAFDPSIYFFADEIAIALRSFTHGYSLFHSHKVLGWHLYDRASRVTHWNDHPEWKRQLKISHRQLYDLYSGKITGIYGTGSKKTIAEYEHYIGMPLLVEAHPGNEQYFKNL